MTLTEFKIKEYLGDAVLRLIVGEIIFSGQVEDRFAKRNLMWKACKIQSNDNLSLTAQRLNLDVHPEDTKDLNRSIHPPKNYANAYEVKVYDLYITEGIEKAKEFVLETLF